MREMLLKAGTVIVGDGTKASDVSILIQENKIAEIGSQVASGSGFEILDFSDRVIMPGIIDTHVHVCHDSTNPDPAEIKKHSDEYLAIRGAKFAEQLLNAGVTTAGDAAGRSEVPFAVKNAIREGYVNGPRLLVCGRMITITAGRGSYGGSNEANGPDDVRRATREELGRGADFIKLAATGAISSEGTESFTTQFNQDELQAAVEEAHKLGKMTHAHSYGEPGGVNTVLAGVDVIVHGHPMTEKTIDLAKKYGTQFMPTLTTYYESLQHHDEGQLPEYMVRKEKELFPSIEGGFRDSVKAGLEIVLGTDSGMPYTPFGPSSMEEMELMVRLGGMSEMDAIVAGTRNAAKALSIDKHVGTIEVGKSADMLVLENGLDPLKNIACLQDPEAVEMVILEGKAVIKR
ncbi:MAG: amidohydrolase family protein [Candidatus Thorarchaeota archaeon]